MDMRCALAVLLFGAAAAMTGVVAQQPRAGSYTSEQATAGRQVYQSHCARCHGARLDGGASGPAVTGEAFARALDVGPMSAPQLYDFITSHMPRAQPGSLTDEQFLQAFAFLLSANGYPTGETPLTKRTLSTMALRPYPVRTPR